MSDLINRQYAIRCIKEMASCADIVHEGKDYAYIIRHYSGNLTGDMHNIWDLFEEIIADLPSADAVEVVRCRDCIHYKLFEFANHDGVPRRKEWFCNSPCCIGGQGIKKPTDYCSYAERKEE